MQLFARQPVAVARGDKMAVDQLQRVQRQRIGEFAVQCGDVGFGGVGEGIHAGVGR